MHILQSPILFLEGRTWVRIRSCKEEQYMGDYGDSSGVCPAFVKMLGVGQTYRLKSVSKVFSSWFDFNRSNPIYVHTVVKHSTIVGTWKIMSKDCIWVRKSKKLPFKPINLWKFCNVNTVAKIIQVLQLWQPMWKFNMNMWPTTAIDVEKCSGEFLLN